MVSITLSVPPELKKRMEAHKEIRWSRTVRAVIERQLDDLEELDRIASKSKLTEKDVEELAALVEEGAQKKWEDLKREASRGR